MRQTIKSAFLLMAFAVCLLGVTAMLLLRGTARVIVFAVWFSVVNAWLAPTRSSYGIATPGYQQSMLKMFYEADRLTTEIDPTLARPTQAARQQALGGTQDIEKKLVHHLKRRQETELGQLARARTAIVPNGKPQERVLTVAPFLARYGPALLPELIDALCAMYAALARAGQVPGLTSTRATAARRPTG